MSSHYDTSQYLLDKADIEDTVYRWSNACDMLEFDKLESDVFMVDKNIIDYTDIFASKVMEMTGKQVSQFWKPRLEGLDATQHITAGVISDLPRPGPNVTAPAKVAAIAETFATFKSDSAPEGRTFLQNGGRYFMELERISNDPSAGNCWRICAVKAKLVWTKGNPDVMGRK